jgi:archaellum component FlaC
MKDIDRLEVLEEKIVQLVEAYSTLKKEKMTLGERLAQKELEAQELAEKVSRLSREKEAVKGRVESLLSRLDHLLVPSRQE